MTHWENIKASHSSYPLQASEEQQIPAFASDYFLTVDKTICYLFALVDNEVLYADTDTYRWLFYGEDDLEVDIHDFDSSTPFQKQLHQLDSLRGTARYRDKPVRWSCIHKEWRFHNHKPVKFGTTPSASASEREDEGEDTARVEQLLQAAQATLTSTLQKVASQPSTPGAPPLSPLSPLSTQPTISAQETGQIPTPPVSKGKQRANTPPPILLAAASTATPAQTSTTPI